MARIVDQDQCRATVFTLSKTTDGILGPKTREIWTSQDFWHTEFGMKIRMKSCSCTCSLKNLFLNIKFSDGPSILEIECGMRAPVNSIIAANLKQIDDFLLSRNIYHPLLAIFLVTKEIQKNVQIW